MAAKPLTTEAIALTEKKMDMTLDEIIKMSKKPTTKVTDRRSPNKFQKPFNAASDQGKSTVVRRYMDSRSYLRQGTLAKRRTNFQEKQFPVAAETAWRAATASVRTRSFMRPRFNWTKPRNVVPLVQRRVDLGGGAGKRSNQADTMPKKRPTLDSLFANMKEQRMRVQQNMTVHVGVGAGSAQLRRDHLQVRHQGRSRAQQFQQGRRRYGNAN